MDRLEKAYSPSSRIRFTYAATTVAAKALEARHLCGPTAAAALAEGLTAVALISADTAAADEAVMLRIKTDGPLGGLLVEATGEGGLRGFTHRKVLDDFDDRTPVDTDGAWGRAGTAQIVTSTPGKILNQAVLAVSPPQVRFVLARYFNHSMQVPTACALGVTANAGGLVSARGLLAQRMADSDADAFVRVLECFEDRRVGETLAKPHAGSVQALSLLGGIFGLPDIAVRETRDLMFKCRCSRNRTLAVLETLSDEELESMVTEAAPPDIGCHMCGNTYTATIEDLRGALDARHR